MLFLETERLYFRSHEPQDETAFVRMQTDPEVRKHVGGQLWLLEKALTRFRKDYLGHPTEVFGLWATILKSPGSYIGCCGLRASSPDANVFLAFYIAKPFWRQGFGSEAARAFIDVAFGRLGLPHLSAEVDTRNEVSLHILQKFGFPFISEESIRTTSRIICTYKLLSPIPAHKKS
jgi:ribosomal-protein-alanine N-acetyltransferase